MRDTRPVSWIRAARKDFEGFPYDAQLQIRRSLTLVAEGGWPDIAKPLKGFGSGVVELAVPHRGYAFRVVYALHVGSDIWVIHGFQKKSKAGIKTPKAGIKTPKAEIDLINARLKRLKEMLK
jgi:phage-related protein